MKKIFVIVLLAAVAGILGFALFWDKGYLIAGKNPERQSVPAGQIETPDDGPLVIGERPERQFMPSGPVVVPDSVIAVSLVFPFDALIRKIRQDLEGQRIKGTGEKDCWGIGPLKTCWQPRWDLGIDSDDPELIRLDEESFAVKLPMRISGEVSSGGRMFNGMELDARLIWLLESRFAPRDNGCPDFSVRMDYRWIKKPKAKYKSFKINLTEEVNEAIDKEINKAEKRLLETFDCEQIRADLARSSTKPVGGSMEPALFVAYQPKAFGMSGYHMMDDRLEMAVQIRSALAVSPDPRVLGSLTSRVETERIDSDQGRIELVIPFELPYALLEQRLRQELTGNTDGVSGQSLGPVMRVERVEVYPSGKLLVIGLKIAVALLKGQIEKSAWMYLSLTPELEEEGKRFVLSSPELISVSKSAAVDLLGLRQDVDAVVRETRQDIDRSIRRALDEQLDQINGIDVDWQHEAARITDLVLAENSLRFVFQLSGDAHLSLVAEQ